MPDQLEQSLREALSQHAAELNPDSIARLRAIDYNPRRHRIRRWPAVGVVGVGGATAVAAVIALASSAAPAFAGWVSKPTPPAPGQLAQAQQDCGANLGNPVLTDTRGPYTVSIYANSTTNDVCLSGSGVSMSSSSTASSPVTVGGGQIELSGAGQQSAGGNALTLVDGRTGAGVTAVTIDRSDGSSVQATVDNGWYLAWWPGSQAATNAKVTTAAGTNTVAFPHTPSLSAPSCPTGAQCGSGYAFGAAGSKTAHGQSTTSVRIGGGSSSGSVSGSSSGGASGSSTVGASASSSK